MRVPAVVRRFTDPLATRIRVPIASGVNRGRWWSLASAGSGYAVGRRAHRQMELLGRLMRPDDVIWDVGAHHGYVALLASQVVGRAGRVHAFEPCASNVRSLRRHLRWNRAENVQVHACALGAFDGEASFGGTGSSKTHALGCGEERVAVRTAASIVAEGQSAPPTFLKLDVEGAEADAVAGALDVLPARSRLLVAVHHAEADRRLVALLRERGYTLIASQALERARSGRWAHDPDLYCAGPEAASVEEDRALLRAADF